MCVLGPRELLNDTSVTIARVTERRVRCRQTPVVDHVTSTIFVLSTRSWAHNNMTGFVSRENSFMDMWVLKSTDIGRTYGHLASSTPSIAFGCTTLPLKGLHYSVRFLS